MTRHSRFLRTPVEPFVVEPGLTAQEIVARMERISFQGRNLTTALRIWHRMLEDDVTIFLGMAGALSAGGLRLIVAHLITNRYVDCLLATGANLYHDLHETRGLRHYIGSAHADDRALAEQRIDRVYDTFASEQEFIDNDNLTSAYRANVSIFCPAIADSSIGMGLSQARQKVPGTGHIDTIGDIVESANLVVRRPRTASVVLGGTPKNFINQASVQAEFYSSEVTGHRYAVQVVTDVAHFGGASGSSLEEAQSWGKLGSDSPRVTVHADATIALPLLASALVGADPRVVETRRKPAFSVASRLMTIDDLSVPSDHFEEVHDSAV